MTWVEATGCILRDTSFAIPILYDKAFFFLPSNDCAQPKKSIIYLYTSLEHMISLIMRY